MFNPLHSSTSQELFEKHLCNQSSHYKKYKWCCVPYATPINYHLKSEVSFMLYCQLGSIHNTAVQINNFLKSTSVIEAATMKIWTISITIKKPSHGTTKSTLFTVSKDEWNTKEDTGKSMKNVMYILQYAKKHILS